MGLDTSTRAISAGIGNARGMLASFFKVIERKHMEYCIPVIERLIKEASIEVTGLSAIVTGLGPGSLIGSRVGLVTAKTLAQVLNLPIIGISTVDIIKARSIEVDGTVYPAPEGFIIKGLQKFDNQQFNSIYDLEPIYLRGPV